MVFLCIRTLATTGFGGANPYSMGNGVLVFIFCVECQKPVFKRAFLLAY